MMRAAGERIELQPAESIPAWDPAIASDRPPVTARPLEASRAAVLLCPWLNSPGLAAFPRQPRGPAPASGAGARRPARAFAAAGVPCELHVLAWGASRLPAQVT